MFKRAIVNNIRNLNKCNRIIRRFEHNNNTDTHKIVDELNDIKKNIHTLHNDIIILNKTLLNIENISLNIIALTVGTITGSCFALLVL